MRKLIALTIFSSSLAACFPTEQGYKNMVTNWIGSPEGALIQKWGAPDKVYRTQRIKYITYNKQSSVYIPGTDPTYTSEVIGNTVYTNSYGGSEGQMYNLSCQTTFSIRKNKIIDVSYKGNDCVALEK